MALVKPIAAAALLALSLLPAQAQEAAPDPAQELRLKLASDLIEMLNLRPMMNQLAAGTSVSIERAYEQQQKKEATEDQKKIIDEVVKVNMAKELPELIPLLAPLTAKAFSEEELKALVEFYKTPVGQGIIDKLPLYQAQSGRLAAGWMQKNMGGVEKQILSDLEGKGIKVVKPQAAAAQPGTQQPAQDAKPSAAAAPAAAQAAKPSAAVAPAAKAAARPAAPAAKAPATAQQKPPLPLNLKVN